MSLNRIFHHDSLKNDRQSNVKHSFRLHRNCSVFLSETESAALLTCQIRIKYVTFFQNNVCTSLRCLVSRYNFAILAPCAPTYLFDCFLLTGLNTITQIEKKIGGSDTYVCVAN